MKVLLSIKPEFATKVFDRSKRFEFRRSIFRNQNIKTVVVYASSPVQKVIGEFEIDKIITDNIDTLWEKTKKYAGISKEYFYSYFNKKEIGFAIKIKNVKIYNKPLCIKKDFKTNPPQSFTYLI
ncbi:MAG: hypothetical protein WKG06_14245 [Segetibacter sp.]